MFNVHCTVTVTVIVTVRPHAGIPSMRVFLITWLILGGNTMLPVELKPKKHQQQKISTCTANIEAASMPNLTCYLKPIVNAAPQQNGLDLPRNEAYLLSVNRGAVVGRPRPIYLLVFSAKRFVFCQCDRLALSNGKGTTEHSFVKKNVII